MVQLDIRLRTAALNFVVLPKAMRSQGVGGGVDLGIPSKVPYEMLYHIPYFLTGRDSDEYYQWVRSKK